LYIRPISGARVCLYSHNIQIKYYNILCIDVVFKRDHIVILLPEEFSAFISFTSRAANIFHASTIMDARKNNIAEERATFIIFIYLFFFYFFLQKSKNHRDKLAWEKNHWIAVVVSGRLRYIIPVCREHNSDSECIRYYYYYYYYYLPLRCTWLYYYGVRLSVSGGDWCCTQTHNI
jgi:hypothetical protein